MASRGVVRLTSDGMVPRPTSSGSAPLLAETHARWRDRTGDVVLERYVDVTSRTSEDVLRYAYMNSFYQTGLRNLLDRAVLAHAVPERNARHGLSREQPAKLVRRDANGVSQPDLARDAAPLEAECHHVVGRLSLDRWAGLILGGDRIFPRLEELKDTVELLGNIRSCLRLLPRRRSDEVEQMCGLFELPRTGEGQERAPRRGRRVPGHVRRHWPEAGIDCLPAREFLQVRTSPLRSG